MSALLKSLKSLRGSRRNFFRSDAHVFVPSLGISETFLYQRKPPFWARWTWALLAGDIAMTVSSIDLSWNRWTQAVPGSEESGPDKATEYELRPIWHRLPLCIVYVGIGVGAAAALVISRVRFVRTFSILPPLPRPSGVSTGDRRRVFIQGAHNSKNGGLVFPISRCLIEEGRDNSEIILRVRDARGHWFMPMNDAWIRGEKVTVTQAHAAILKEWGSARRFGKWTNSPEIMPQPKGMKLASAKS